MIRFQPVEAQDSFDVQPSARIMGVVTDGEGRPIVGANVTLLATGRTSKVGTYQTDFAGGFDIEVNLVGEFLVIVTCDITQTPGMDYVPERWLVTLSSGSVSTRQFVLRKGASIYMEGEIRDVESKKPAQSTILFDVIERTVSYPSFSTISSDASSTSTMIMSDNWAGSITRYGTYSDLTFLGFDERHVVVPANLEVQIRILAEFERATSISGNPQMYTRTFIVSEKTGYFKLSQGELLHYNLEEASTIINIEFVKDQIDSAFYLLGECLDAGFLVEVEKRDLQNSYSSINEALFLVNKGQCAESFAKTRKAYLTVARSKIFLQDLIKTGLESTISLLFLFSFLAVAAAYLISERKTSLQIVAGKRRLSFPMILLIEITFYSFLVSFFYFVYPGCHLLPQLIFIVMAVLALIVGQASTFGPRILHKEKTSEYRSIQIKSAFVTAFSLGSRNLRRRRLRTALSLVNIMVLVFGFITLTSISPGYGLISRQIMSVNPVDAVLIRDESTDGMTTFIALPPSFARWLESQPNITMVSKKAENQPVFLMNPLGQLTSTSGKTAGIFGVLGIVPSSEASLINLDDIIVEGKYLEDEDMKGILTSSSIKENLGVDVGDPIYIFDQEFIIRGFFDSNKLDQVYDIDGSLIVPYAIEPFTATLVPCSGDVIIILTYDRAITIPEVSTSRVIVQMKTTENCDALAQIIALTYEYTVYVSHKGSMYRLEMGEYMEEKGMGMVPFIMSLVIVNIAISMIGSIKERRDEIISLSSIGLNPTHIAALFVAEAAIIGIVGGGLGYLMGILGYRIASTSVLGVLEVREKASAEWGLMAIILSISTAIIAALVPSLKASTMVTPSLLRKWRIGENEKPRKVGQPYIIYLPLKLMPREIDSFTGFVLKRISDYSQSIISKLGVEDETTEKGVVRKIGFEYFILRGGKTDNKLIIKPEDGSQFSLVLYCVPASPSQQDEEVHETASFVRKILFEWNSMTFEVATAYDPTLSQLYNLINSYNPTSLYIITVHHDVEQRLETLKQALVTKGIRIPRFIISKVDPYNIANVMKVAEEIVSRADVVCISGEPPSVVSALATYAARNKKIECYVVDKRPMEVRMKYPFQELKIENIT
ncbi:hypothetical protein KEJ18_06345 [Candidatus Bathyarchaeota archaeon]|nr:hypothetical protein [Candidatus Bathyarchaeota archaeon]